MAIGIGVLNSIMGEKYDGEWDNDDNNGKGVAYYTDSTKYDGEWKDGKRYGQGIGWINE